MEIYKMYEKIKILYISVRSDVGGGPKHISQLLKNFDHQKYDVYIACPDDEPFYKLFVNYLGQEKVFQIPHRTFSIKHILAIKNRISKNEIAIVHSHGKGAGIYSRLLKILDPKLKVIHTYHGIHYKGYNKFQKSLYFFMEFTLSFITKKIICVSESEKEEAITKKITHNSKKLTTIINGVTVPETMKNKEINKEINIVIVSRFDYQKNTGLLISIIKNILENIDFKINFYLLGTGEEQYLLNNIKEEHPNNIFILNNISNPSLYYEKCHFILNTSRWEGLPLSVLEAMAHGCIPILTNVTGNKDIIATSNPNMGLLYNETHEVIDYLQKFLLKEIDFKNSSKINYDIAHKLYNEKKMIKETFNLY